MSNFEPKDLNFETVQQIFKECMPVENESKNICAVQLQQLMNGFPSDSEPIYFDIDKLEENKQNIKLNSHQIMKIDAILDKEFTIYFDNFQTIKIKK